VSAHQGQVDWGDVAADRVRFAYLKATEGGDLVDRTFQRNWNDARRAGLRVGAYHFFTLCRPAADQAANFLRTAPPAAGALPPAVDLEIVGNCRARPSRDQVATEVDQFLSEVEGAWRTRVLIYTDEPFEELYPVRERLGRDLWTRRFLLRPSQRWTIWQLHGLARVDGVSGPVDLNVGRLVRLEELATASAG
jgi:lysozyme